MPRSERRGPTPRRGTDRPSPIRPVHDGSIMTPETTGATGWLGWREQPRRPGTEVARTRPQPPLRCALVSELVKESGLIHTLSFGPHRHKSMILKRFHKANAKKPSVR